MNIATVTIGNRGLQALNGKVDTLNRKATRHGLQPITVMVNREFSFIPVKRGEVSGRLYFGGCVTLYDVTVSGIEPRINGWRLLARVEFDNILGNVVNLAPGVSGVDERFGTIGPVCEHCNSIRRRNDIFVLEHSDGSVKVVGRNCLADFLRCGDAETLARYAELSENIRAFNEGDCDEDYECFGGRLPDPVLSMSQFLPVVAMLTRKLGWVSRTEAKDSDGCATADSAIQYIYGKNNDKWIEKHNLYVEPIHTDLANCAIEWCKGVGGNEYLNTIQRISVAGKCNSRHAGYAASIIVAYAKARDKENDKKENKGYFGEVGKRYRGVAVTVKRIHSTVGMYGVTTIVTMVTGEGQVLTWFASGEKDFTENTDYTVDFTVKKHEDNRYGKATIITRGRVS